MNKKEFVDSWNSSHSKEKIIKLKNGDILLVDEYRLGDEKSSKFAKDVIILFNEKRNIGFVHLKNIDSIYSTSDDTQNTFIIR